MRREPTPVRSKPGRSLWLAQAVIAFGGVGSLILAPPAHGQMALYPITASAGRDLPKIMVADNRALVARTSIAGGYVVQGTRPSPFDLLFEHGILVLAVPESGCSGASNAER